MDRRRFTALSAAAGAAALAACGPGPGHDKRDTGESAAVVTRPRVRWRLASSFPRATEILYGAAETFAARVEALTDGRFVIEPNEAGALVPPFGVLDAVQSGSIEIGHTAGYYYLGKNPALVFDTALPFGMQARQHDAWMLHGDGRELAQRRLADFGIVSFPGGNTGTQMGGWFRDPVGSLAEIRGLKMRIPGLGAGVMERLGVIAQSTPGGEIYGALERGAIDATEWVGPYDDARMGFQNVVQTYHYPGWWEPSASLSFYVNERLYAALPEAYQAAIGSAAAEANAATLQRYDAANPPALAELAAGGVRTVPFPVDVMQAAAAAAQELLDDTASGADADYRECLASYRAFQAASDRWLGTAELGMARFSAGRVTAGRAV